VRLRVDFIVRPGEEPFETGREWSHTPGEGTKRPHFAAYVS
jgi:hypothetical protein